MNTVRLCIALLVAWLYAHGLAAARWMFLDTEDAIIAGEMMAVLAFPVVVLVVYGMRSRTWGLLLALSGCAIAVLIGIRL